MNWRNRADWKAKCMVEKQSGLESGILAGITERIGERNVDWKNRGYWRAES
jgi:hypothetical protein